MNGEEKVYFGEKIESKETDLEKIKVWLGERDLGQKLAVNIGGAGEKVNAIRKEVIDSGGKYLVIDPEVETRVEDGLRASLKGGVAAFIEFKNNEVIKFASPLDDLGTKADVIELNYVLGRMPIPDGVSFLNYLREFLSDKGEIVIRNSSFILPQLLGLGSVGELRAYGWEVENKKIEKNDFESEYHEGMGSMAVKLILRSKG